MPTYHQFDETKIANAMATAKKYYTMNAVKSTDGVMGLEDDGHLVIHTECITVEVDNGNVCFDLPLHLGKKCIPLPIPTPTGTAASVCLDICFKGIFPKGVTVTITVLGHVVVTKSFGSC